MRAVCIIFLTVLFTGATASAQKIAQEKLDKIVSDFAHDGYKLEHIYEPNFTIKNPNTPSRFVPCYTGKSVIVAAVMAFKPQNFQFQVLLNGKEAPKTHDLENIGKNGENLFYDYRALKFGPKFVSKNQNCLNILLSDKAAPDKAVYTLVFTKAG